MKIFAILLAATVFAQKWAEVYMDQHPDTRIQVSGGAPLPKCLRNN